MRIDPSISTTAIGTTVHETKVRSFVSSAIRNWHDMIYFTLGLERFAGQSAFAGLLLVHFVDYVRNPRSALDGIKLLHQPGTFDHTCPKIMKRSLL